MQKVPCTIHNLAELKRQIVPGAEMITLSHAYDAGKQYPELFISNYDTYEEGWNAKQLTLFDDDSISEKILKERKIVWKGN